MTAKKFLKAFAVCLWLILLFISCNTGNPKKEGGHFRYESFRDSILLGQADTTGDSSNIFDADVFTPGVDSLDTLLARIDTLWKRDIGLTRQMDSFITHIKKEELFTPEERARVKENVERLDSFLLYSDSMEEISCRGNDCLLYAEIIKSTQTLYLYIEGELKDSFKVSTGIKKYETPRLNTRPRGPLFTKYTSRKFPGGNYKGLGNMPYAVFVTGGYAIHGTTPGNFSRLGTRASHGCIRLHPDHARIFFELVKLIGLNHTWVTIKDSLPL